MGISWRGIRTASSGLPDIQPKVDFTLHEKSYPGKLPTIIKLFYVSKNICGKEKHFVCGGFMSRNCADAVTNPKGYHNEESL